MTTKHANQEIVAQRIETIKRNPRMHARNSLEAMEFCTVDGTVHLDILEAHEAHAADTCSE